MRQWAVIGQLPQFCFFRIYHCSCYLYVYVMAFKLKGLAEDALRQINERHCARPFEAEGRRMFKIGGDLSKVSRVIGSRIVARG